MSLTPTEWSLLELLVRNPEKLITQQQLRREVWGPAYAKEANYLRVYMAQLRRKLEPEPGNPRHLLTESASATGSNPELRDPAPNGYPLIPHHGLAVRPKTVGQWLPARELRPGGLGSAPATLCAKAMRTSLCLCQSHPGPL